MQPNHLAHPQRRLPKALHPTISRFIRERLDKLAHRVGFHEADLETSGTEVGVVGFFEVLVCKGFGDDVRGCLGGSLDYGGGYDRPVVGTAYGGGFDSV